MTDTAAGDGALVRRMKKFRAKTVFLVLAAACLTGAQAAHGGGGTGCDFDGPPDVISPPLEAPFVFETIELSDGSGRRYEVRLPFCGDLRCPVEVLLRDDGTVYDTAQFSECAVAQQPSRVDGHWNLGIGDPLLSDKGLTVWGTGYENLFVSVHARPIELAEDRRGLMLHFIGGGEHMWRNHYLLIEQDDRLDLAWSAREIAGAGLVAIDLADIDGDGFPEILHFYGSTMGYVHEPSGEVLGDVEAAVYRWNEGKGKIEQLSLAEAGQPIYAVVGGMFDSIAAVMDASSTSASCLWLYYALATEQFPGLPPNKFILAKFTWDRGLAETQLAACNPSGDAFVVEIAEISGAISRARLP